MSICCAYKDCFNKRYPCSKICFFRLPLDPVKREKWIKNSGNQDLISIGPTTIRLFCEDHFEEKYMRRQFNRTTLHPDAELIPWNPKIAQFSKEFESTEMPTVKKLRLINTVKDIQQDIQSSDDTMRIENNLDQDMIDQEIYEVISIDRSSIKSVEVLEESSEIIPVQDLTNNEDINDSIKKHDDLPLIIVKNEGTQNTLLNGQTSCKNYTKSIGIQTIQEPSPEFSANKPIETSTVTTKVNEKLDEDQYFCLNVISGLLKRLSPEKRSEAKLHILSYLYKLEQGDQLN